MDADLSVFHAIGDLDPRSGGPSRAVVELTDALSQQPGVSVTLLFQSRSGQASVESHCTQVRRVAVCSRSRWASRASLHFRAALECEIRRAAPTLIHVHGLWLPLDHWSVAAARRHRIPLIVQPHGMLEPWALNHRGWKKRVGMALYQRRDLAAAQLLIASTAREYESLRQQEFRQPVAVIPHGVRAIAAAEPAPANAPNGPNRVRTALFLSRLHPVKGLPSLINAWARLSPPGWRLIIAGPDQGGHLQEIQSAIRRLGVSECVQYVGEVRDEAKSALYRAADLFVLPTHTENFGMVIAEALAHGVPVITTRGAPWAELETHRCGWWIDIGEEPLVNALREAMTLSDAARREMGSRGRQLAQRYEWTGIGGQLHAAYRWVLGRGERPESVMAE